VDAIRRHALQYLGKPLRVTAADRYESALPGLAHDDVCATRARARVSAETRRLALASRSDHLTLSLGFQP
jgi:hypothetical protein